MKKLKIWTFLLFIAIAFLSIPQVKAQCAMCSVTADAGVKNGNTQAKGLNNGIMFLLAAPYLAVAAGGYVWYKKYRRRNVEINLHKKDFHLN